MDNSNKNKWDFENVELLLYNENYNNFSALLLRLIAKADLENKEKIRIVFPEHVEAFEKYIYGEN